MLKMGKRLEDSKMISVCLELSDNCRVGCPYCLLEEKKDETSKEQMLDIIQAIDAYGVVRYTIGGGEPLDISYVYEIGKFIKSLHHEALLRTSGCNYIDIEKIKESFDLVDISVDSYKKETMKICKPQIDSNIVYKNIKEICRKNINCRCNILITKYNYDDIIPTIEWLAENGIRNIRIQKLVKRGRAKAIFDDICVSDEKYYELLNFVFNVCDELNLHIKEVKSVNSQTLCIIKPNGELYVGTPTGLIKIGDVFNVHNLNTASEMVYANQKKFYGVDRYAGT